MCFQDAEAKVSFLLPHLCPQYKQEKKQCGKGVEIRFTP